MRIKDFLYSIEELAISNYIFFLISPQIAPKNSNVLHLKKTDQNTLATSCLEKIKIHLPKSYFL